MKSFSCRILSVFVLQFSTAFAVAVRSPSSFYNPKPEHSKREPEKIILGVAFENFREFEAKSLGDEVREVLSQIVPAALTAAIQKDDP